MLSDESWRTWANNGDWTVDPWFTRDDGSWHDEWSALGLLLEKRRIATEALKKIFPAEVCRTLLGDGTFEKFGPVVSLFGVITTPPLVAPLLELGLDASVVHPWNDPDFMKRLYLREKHEDAAFELRVHAALARAKFIVERVPEAPPATRYDLHVRSGDREYEVEVKLQNEPDLNGVAKQMQEVFAASELMVPGLHLELHGSEVLAEQALEKLSSLHGSLRDVVSEFVKCASRIRAAPATGQYAAGDVGFIIAKPGPKYGAFTNLVLPELSDDKKASRVVRKIRDGLSQLSGQHTGVLVVGVFNSAHPFFVEKQVVERARKNPLWKKCRVVVLVHSLPPPPDLGVREHRVPAVHIFSPHKYRSLRPQEVRLGVAAGSTHQGEAVRIGLPRPGRFAITMNTERSPVTMWSAGKAKLQPGGTVSFTFRVGGEAEVREIPPPDAPGESK